MANKTSLHYEKFRDAERKVSLEGGIVLGDKQWDEKMLEDKHCSKFRGVITCRNAIYYGLLGRTM